MPINTEPTEPVRSRQQEPGHEALRVYLAGKVPKGVDIGATDDWRSVYVSAMAAVRKIDFLSPDDPTLDERLPLTVFGHDCLMVRECDLLIVNASTKLGVGTAQEMLLAKYFRKPVLTLLPRDTHHRRSNLQMHAHLVRDWIHPFIWATSDRIFDDLASVVAFLKSSELDDLLLHPKSMEIVDEAEAAYRAFRNGNTDRP